MLQSIGLRQLQSREEYLYNIGKEFWTQNCLNMTILGCGSVHRLPIFSFIVTHPTVSKLVHHNFISTLLNDLYGIQTRGGCACAGPYGEVCVYATSMKHIILVMYSFSKFQYKEYIFDLGVMYTCIILKTISK